MRERLVGSKFPEGAPPPGKVWYTTTDGRHLAFTAKQRKQVLQNLVFEGLRRPQQYDDTPEVAAAHKAEEDAAEQKRRAEVGPSRVRLGYAAAGFSTALINNVFILYHVKLYTTVYAVSDGWLYTVFTLYGFWNTLNDPLFGWIEDRMASGSLANSLQRRLFALRAGGIGLALAFMMLFVPWWPMRPGAPPPASWVVGLHMLVCMSCYDAALTWVCQAHNALLAELTTDNVVRAELGRHSSAAMMLGSCSALIAFYAWNLLPFWSYQLVCALLATAAALTFEFAYQLLAATAPFGRDHGNGNHGAGEDGKGRGEMGSLTGGGGKDSIAGGGGLCNEAVTFVRFAREAAGSRSLGVFLLFGLCQQLNCTFNTSFFPLMVEILLSTQLPGWVSTLVLLTSFILPHLLTIQLTKLAGRLQECYPIIRVLNFIKLFNSAGLLLGTTCLPLATSGPARSCLILFAMVANRNVTECGCRLSSLVMADCIDEDRVRHQRAKPMSSSVAGLHAIASKPGQSLAPIIGWHVLRSTGYTGGTAVTATTAAGLGLGADVAATPLPAGGGVLLPTAGESNILSGSVPGYEALLGLLIFLPGCVGLVQVCLWQVYTLHGPALAQLKAKIQALEATVRQQESIHAAL